MPSSDTNARPVRTLVLGGARSGKSAYAEGIVSAGRSVRYIATGRRDPADPDWEERIDQHQARRPHSWTTVETARDADLEAELRSLAAQPTIVDDLGTWLTAEIDSAAAWDLPRGTIGARLDGVVDAVRCHVGTLVLVTPEVGQGVIPETRSGRLFRDEIGALNSRLAQVCDRVVLVVAGLPLVLKDVAAQSKGPA